VPNCGNSVLNNFRLLQLYEYVVVRTPHIYVRKSYTYLRLLSPKCVVADYFVFGIAGGLHQWGNLSKINPKFLIE